MKRIFLGLLLGIIFCVSVNAQYLNFKGLTVQATTALYIENGEPKSVNIYTQIFAMSFSDKILLHIIYEKGDIIEQSQIYKIENDINFIDESGNEKITVYKFEAISGITNKRFYYELKINSNGNLLSFKLTQPDIIEFTIFKGGITLLKPYQLDVIKY